MQSLQKLPWSPILMGIASILFVIAKWADLSLPFFWDELGVYGPGVLAMVDEGIGLLPSALPPDLSRGHPLFFYFFFAAWTKIVGYSIVKIHFFALMVTLGVAWTTWWIGYKLLHEAAGAIAGIAVLMMPFIFAQAHLILPEMLLGGLMLWGLYSFHQRKWWAYLIWGSLAVLTKESALVMVMACLTYSLLFGAAERWKMSLISLSPLIGFALFLIIQRFQNGWFFFPYHTGFISFDWVEMQGKFVKLWNFILEYQGRWAIQIGLGIGLIAFLWRKRTLNPNEIHPWFQLSGIFLLGMMAFTVINFYMDRYLLSLLPILVLGLGAAIRELFLLGKAWRYLSIAIFLIPLNFIPHHQGEEFRYDTDINYRSLLSVQQAAVDLMIQEAQPTDSVFAGFPIYYALKDPRYGFTERYYPLKLTGNPRAEVDLAGFMYPGVRYEKAINDSLKIWTQSQGYSWAEVFRRNP
ncbi:MAG: glycosyltransferase family 39 protein [Bacteroidota bacterium]